MLNFQSIYYTLQITQKIMLCQTPFEIDNTVLYFGRLHSNVVSVGIVISIIVI